MIIIRESKVGAESIYRYIVSEDHEEKILRDIRIESAKVKDEQGKVFIFLYDTNKKVIREVFRYVNFEIEKQSYNSQYLALQALRLLFIYCEIFDLNYKELDLKEARKIKQFLIGNSVIGGTISFETVTSRSNDTVNTYLGVYRAFYEYLGVKKSPFHEKKLSKMSFVNIKDNDLEKGKYILIERSQKDNKKVPMYIKPQELTRMLEVVRKGFTLRDEIIIRFMFECGMRIGEVLGLTLEDIITTPEEIDSRNFDDLGAISIRNRLTDEKYQLAKSCIIPKSQRDYKKKSYITENIGYQFVYPSIILLSKLEQYIQDVHGDMSIRNRINYVNSAKADKVSDNECLEGENYYVFLNKNAKPLNISGWNKTLRNIFQKSGLVVDTGVRKHNLNHRFRHGYAMFLKKHKKATEIDLMYALRHKSPESVVAYFRPDDDDIYKANEEALISMMDICPLLIR